MSATLQQVVVHAAPVRTVGLTGQAAAGTPSGVSYASFGSFHHPQPEFSRQYFGPVLNDAGQTAFRADLSGNGVDSTNYQGVWSEGSGSLTLVARTGNQAPGAPDGVNFAIDPGLELYSPVLNNAGHTAFYGALNDGRVGLWSEGTGSLALVAADGQQAAGVEVGVVHSFANLDLFLETPVLNDAGETAFRSFLTGGGANDTNFVGLWSGSSGNTALVARLGSQAPGTPSGVTFGSPQPPVLFYVDRFLPVLNNVGQAVIYSHLTGSGVDSSNDSGLWSGDSDSLDLVARTGSQAPGLPIGVNYTHEISLTTAINSAGHVAFVAGLTSENTTLHQDGIWSDRSGTLELVAHRGNQAPGTPAGVNFDFFRIEARLNDASQIAFYAVLTGTGVDSTNDRGIWLDDSGNMTLVARTGNQAPGTPGGVYYSTFSPTLVGWTTLNAVGQVAFGAALTGDGVDSTNDRGIWATDLTGATQLIVRTGEELQVAPGDVRTVSAVKYVGGTSNNNGWPSGFNNFGQVAFWASFTDGTQGVFISNEVANFAWKNLTKVHFFGADLTGADLTGADARGAPALNLSGVTTTNLIHPDGHIDGLNLAAGEKLVAYPDVPILVQVSGGFSIAPTATFDLTDNDAIVQSTAANKAAELARLYGYVKQGYNGGDWQGTGITSSTAAGDPGHRTTLAVADNALLGYTEFSGQSVTADSILLKYTYYGDIDVNGQVDADDLTVFANNFGTLASMTQIDGDLDFNGAIDADDLTVFANNFGNGLGNPLSASAPQAVPEPSSLPLVGSATAACCLFMVRLRRCRWASLLRRSHASHWGTDRRS